MKKRILSLLLVFCAAVLIFSALPVTASAETEGDWEYSVNSGLATVTKYNGTDAVVTIPDKFGNYQVTSIGKSAFEGNATITMVNFPKGLTTIGKYAFKGCVGLTTVTLPEKLTSLGGHAFENCTSLTEIIVNAKSLDNIRYDSWDASISKPFNNTGTAGDGITVTFGPDCTRVPERLFWVDDANITKVVIGDNVTEIGAYAFQNCTQLTTVDFGKVVTIGKQAFSGCSALHTFEWSDKLTTIGTQAFENCTGLTAVVLPGSVTTIQDNAFFACTGLESITLPSSLVTIGKYSFSGCVGLTTVTLPEKLTSLGGHAFENCTSLTEIIVNAKSLGNIRYDSWDASISKPFNNTGTAGDGITVTFGPDCTKVPERLFWVDDANITKVVIGDNVTEIAAYAFQNCTQLTTVDFGKAVTIGQQAFSGCSALNTFEWSEALTTIGTQAFENCIGITAIELPDSVTAIQNNAFSGCSKLSSVVLSKGLISIGKYAFADCTSLTAISLPEKLTSLGGHAFEGCTTLAAVEILSTSLGDIGYDSWDASISKPFSNAGTAGDGITVTFAEGCTRVPARLFWADNVNLTAVVLGSDVTEIAAYAFQDCTQLTTVDFGEVVTIGQQAFSGCSALNAIEWSEVLTTIGTSAFEKCTGLTAVTLPGSVTNIKESAFANCSKLVTVTLPDGLITIGKYAFTNCSALTAITLPEKLTTLGGRSFEGCTSLEKVIVESVNLNDIPYDRWDATVCKPFNNAGTAGNGITAVFAEGCTRVPGRIFWVDNNNLTSVTVHKDVTEVGISAFSNSVALKTINFLGDAPTIADNAFTNVVATGYHNGWPQEALLDYGGNITWVGEVAACKHENTTTVNAEEATCTAAGYTGDTICNACGETVKAGETIPALGHTEEIVPAVAPTCKNTGLTEGKKCSVCGTVTVAQETVPVVDHTWDEGKVTEEPTDMEEGEKLFTCTVCQETKTEVLPKLDHEHSYSTTVTEPTCTEGGYTTYSCHCGDTYKGDETQALGHSWDEGKITKEPTAEADGEKLFTCTVCQETKTESVRYVDPDIPPVPEIPEEPVEETSVVRIAGSNRFETAFMVANQMKKNLGVEKFDAIIVASGTNFADALSGSYLAAVKKAPILLSYNEAINDQVKNYIRENLTDGGIVYILGGESAVPASIEEGMQGIQVKRLAGNDRFGTNLAILEEAGVGDNPILVCTGIEFADSLSASATEMPILLVWRHLTEEQKAYLDGLESNKFYIIGGTNAVSDTLRLEVGEFGAAKRLGGSNRFETSVMIAKEFFADPDDVVLAYAWNFPDGLCGGALASTMKAPLILTMTKWETQAMAYAKEAGITNGIVLGGTGLISDDSVRMICSMK